MRGTASHRSASGRPTGCMNSSNAASPTCREPARAANGRASDSPVTAEKLETAAPFVVAPISVLTHLVTECGVPEHSLAAYRARGITITRA